jgi:hypothetical protein
MRTFCGFDVHYVNVHSLGDAIRSGAVNEPFLLSASDASRQLLPFRDRVFLLPSGISLHLRKFDSYSLIALTAGDLFIP